MEKVPLVPNVGPSWELFLWELCCHCTSELQKHWLSFPSPTKRAAVITIQFSCWRPGANEATGDFPESLCGSGAQGGTPGVGCLSPPTAAWQPSLCLAEALRTIWVDQGGSINLLELFLNPETLIHKTSAQRFCSKIPCAFLLFMVPEYHVP